MPIAAGVCMFLPAPCTCMGRENDAAQLPSAACSTSGWKGAGSGRATTISHNDRIRGGQFQLLRQRHGGSYEGRFGNEWGVGKKAGGINTARHPKKRSSYSVFTRAASHCNCVIPRKVLLCSRGSGDRRDTDSSISNFLPPLSVALGRSATLCSTRRVSSGQRPPRPKFG